MPPAEESSILTKSESSIFAISYYLTCDETSHNYNFFHYREFIGEKEIDLGVSEFCRGTGKADFNSERVNFSIIVAID